MAIHSSRIISAFQNEIDESSLDYYRNKSSEEWGNIMGYESIIDEDDVENTDKTFISGEEITSEHIGEKVFYVTDGHHRSIIACELGINLSYVIDSSTIC